MLVINFIGQPGAGKSTFAAGLFYELKRKGYNVELVTEYTKDAIYEENSFVLSDELLVFAEKYKRIKRLSNSVDIVITDSPLINSIFYSDEFGIEGEMFFRSVANKFENKYIFVERVVPYVPHARIPDVNEADKMAKVIEGWLNANSTDHLSVKGDEQALNNILSWVDSFIEYRENVYPLLNFKNKSL